VDSSFASERPHPRSEDRGLGGKLRGGVSRGRADVEDDEVPRRSFESSRSRSKKGGERERGDRGLGRGIGSRGEMLDSEGSAGIWIPEHELEQV
jgi:hypothetical protein